MITGLSLRRFKRFAELDIAIAPLTVLTGRNSAGKSTIIQSLLLARAALRTQSRRDVPLRSEDGLALGAPNDVLHQGSSDTSTDEIISIQVRSRDAASLTLSFGFPSDDPALHLTVLESSGTIEDQSLLANEPAFTYLCAERCGPRDTLAAAAGAQSGLGVGIHGGQTAQVLALQERTEVSLGRHAKVSATDNIEALRFLTRQTELWLAQILGLQVPLTIEATWLAGTSTTTLRFQSGGPQSPKTRPINVGFGLSYALPIVVAALQAPRGGTLIVENPEAHLHPAGQSAMGAFLAQVVGDGVQVIIETHSDHVINGIRRAVVEGSISLRAADATFLFFRDPNDGGRAVDAIDIRDTGELAIWPRGFFDQIERDLGAIARAQRGKRK